MSHEIMQVIEEHGKAVAEFTGRAEKKEQEFQARLLEVEQKLDRRGTSDHYSVDIGLDSDAVMGALVGSDQFAIFAKGAQSTGRVAIGELSIKALTNVGRGQATGDSGYDVPAQRAPGLYGLAQRRLTLLDVLPSLRVTAGTFEYLSVDGYTNAAAYQQKEGDLKAEADLKTALKQAQIQTIAHWIKASTQILADAPALSQQIGNLLHYGLLQKLESEIINGTGGTNSIEGLLAHATAFSPVGTPTPANALGQAITSLQASGWQAGLIVMNPADWFVIASATATDGQYIIGSPRDPSPLNLWGTAVTLTPSLATGTALVLDPAQVAVLDRQEPVLMVSRDDGDNFRRNLVTILAEMRAGLAVFAPDAVLSVDLAAEA